VLLDHHMVPTDADIGGWLDAAAARGARTIRTGALFPDSSPVFVAAGFRVVETLTLLRRPIGNRPAPLAPPTGRGFGHEGLRLRRLRRTQLDDAAALDARSFVGSWPNDAAAIRDIMDATPQHRSRVAMLGGRMVGFSVNGRAGRVGYIQRLAVDPDVRRRGVGRVLVVDALTWMHRRQLDDALVNTGSDNTAALELYRGLGFVELPEPLLVLERDLAAP
jgi:GNAT superfamily N-acetyltransferase